MLMQCSRLNTRRARCPARPPCNRCAARPSCQCDRSPAPRRPPQRPPAGTAPAPHPPCARPPARPPCAHPPAPPATPGDLPESTVTARPGGARCPAGRNRDSLRHPGPGPSRQCLPFGPSRAPPGRPLPSTRSTQICPGLGPQKPLGRSKAGCFRAPLTANHHL